ncbi:MAG: hypothetical protein KJ955_06015 [Nanoarchaeota archaeon]|nr:hypothetical protein [Nanoarchaeota archaeon]
MTHYDALPYNVFTGVLPECLQLSTINDIFNEKLRNLPTTHFVKECENTVPELHDENAKKIEQKVVWHIGKRKKYLSKGYLLKRKASRLLFSCF